MRRSSGDGASCAIGLLRSASFSPGKRGSKLRAARGKQRRIVIRKGIPIRRPGVDIVRKEIRAPARPIDNSGADGAVVVGKLLEAKEYGYDAQTGEYGDLVAALSIQPRSCARPLQDAAWIAGLIVTTEATITEHPKKEAPALPQGGGMGGMDY
jgi:chaperonin GroEL